MSLDRNKCPVCENTSLKEVFNAIFLKKYEGAFYFCEKCHFLFIKDPNWLNEAYKEPINVYDTGVLSRNITFSKLTSVIIYFLFNKDSRFLDYGGGYGIFTRLMRDIGFDFYWLDQYSPNLVARGFEITDLSSKYELLTCFEVFEHVYDPIKEIEKMFSYSDSILFSTQVLPEKIPKLDEWDYYGLKHGQHISFYSLETLSFIAKKFSCNLLPYKKSLFLLTKRNLNTSFFRILYKLIGRERIYSYVKKQMKSKTIDDNEFLSSTTE